MILHFNPSHRQKFETIQLAKFNAFEALERSIRFGFDNATSISVAEGYIQTALELNRFDLAADMIADLQEVIENRRATA